MSRLGIAEKFRKKLERTREMGPDLRGVKIQEGDGTYNITAARRRANFSRGNVQQESGRDR
ncbi:MAG: hypothetical protein E7310_04530 [Clostridiales bacterium]|nr:hypothetical protein [Clostridiales bacterium]